MKVKALSLGYYNHKRRREGDIFILTGYKTKAGKVVTPTQEFSKIWMEVVDDGVKETDARRPKITGQNANQAMDIQGQLSPGHPGMSEEVKQQNLREEKANEAKANVDAGGTVSKTSNEEVI